MSHNTTDHDGQALRDRCPEEEDHEEYVPDEDEDEEARRASLLRMDFQRAIAAYGGKTPPRITQRMRGPFLEGFEEELPTIPEDREPPPPYSESADPEWRLTYVDFAPRCYDEGRILTSPKFETFDVLVARANDYLRRHPKVFAKSMETTRFTVMELKKPGTVVDTSLSTLDGVSKPGTTHIMALRMWICPKVYPKVQQVGYMNVVPACLDPGGVFKRPVFDTLLSTTAKLNRLFHEKPPPGTIISVETVRHLFVQHSNWVEPDRCHRRIHGDLNKTYLTFIRIYYEAGPHKSVTLGYKDFIPSNTRSITDKDHPAQAFDFFDDLVHQANDWLKRQTNICLINMETVFFKFKKGGELFVNTDQVLCSHQGSCSKLQCLRVWYNTAQSISVPPVLITQTNPTAHPANIPDVCRHELKIESLYFCPQRYCPDGLFQTSAFEEMFETRQRMKNWALNNDRHPLISAETVYVHLDHSLPPEFLPSISFHSSQEYSSTEIAALRLYVLDRSTDGAAFAHDIPGGVPVTPEALAAAAADSHV